MNRAMNLSTRLKCGTAVFIVIWVAGMLWWSGSLAPGNVISTTVGGLIVGCVWYYAMRWHLLRRRLPRGADTGSTSKP
jgi:membrane associated rhomboid family serine protease